MSIFFLITLNLTLSIRQVPFVLSEKRLVNERIPLSLLKLEFGIKCDKIIHLMTYDVLMTDEYLMTTVTIPTTEHCVLDCFVFFLEILEVEIIGISNVNVLQTVAN